jgi:hypothetical protein
MKQKKNKKAKHLTITKKMDQKRTVTVPVIKMKKMNFP